MTITLTEYFLLAPEIFVLTMACLILVVEAFVGDKYRQASYVLSQLTLLVAAFISGSLIDNEALVMLGEQQEIEVIRAALFAPPEQGELTALACMMCGRLRDHRAVPNLARLALQTGPTRQPAEVRMAATWALAHMETALAAKEGPLEYVADPLLQLRSQAALTLGEIGDPGTLADLAVLLDDPSPVVQVAAAGGILRIDSRSPTGRNRP